MKKKKETQVYKESEFQLKMASFKTKKITAHTYKTLFKPHKCLKPQLLDTDEAIKGPKVVVTDESCFKKPCVEKLISLKKDASTGSERTGDGVVSESGVKCMYPEAILVTENASDSRRKSVCSIRKRVDSVSTENDLSPCGSGAVNKDLDLLFTCKKRAQYSNESLREPNLAAQDVNRKSFNGGAESVLSKLPDVAKEIGVKSPSEEHSRGETDDKISELERKCRKRLKKLQRTQLEKIQEFNKIWDEKREQLNKDLQLETAFIRSVFSEVSVATERIKLLDKAFACKIDKHNLMRDVELKNLEADQLAAVNVEIQKAERWLTAAKACNAEAVAVYVPPSIDDNAGVPQLEINTTIDTTRIVAESVEQVANKIATESESTRHCPDKILNVDDSTRHSGEQSPSESMQQLEDPNHSESVCANGNASAPANTSIFTRAEMSNLVTTNFRKEVVEKDIDEPSVDMIEPIPSGNLQPWFISRVCRSVYVGNIQIQVTEPLLHDVFAITGPIESCRLIRLEKSSYGFVHYFDRRSAALAIQSLNGRHVFGEPIRVNWAYSSGLREDTSSYYNIFVGGLSSEVTDAMLYAFFSVYPSCSYARIMWDKTTGLPRGFGIVSFRNQEEAQSAITNLTGKWLGRSQIFCSWATPAATSDNKPNSYAKNVLESTNGSSDDLKEVAASDDAPENNLQYTTVFVGGVSPEVNQDDFHRHFHALGAGSIEEVRIHRSKGYGFVRYSTHAEAALAISMGNNQSYLFGHLIHCSWGSKPTPPGTSSNPLPPPQPTGLFSSNLVAYVRHLTMTKMSGFNTLMHSAQDQPPSEQGGSVGGMVAGANQAIYDGGFQNVAASNSSCTTSNQFIL